MLLNMIDRIMQIHKFKYKFYIIIIDTHEYNL